MQNQDPLEPTSNTEFISQMASFTALQSQQDSYDTQLQTYANSLVGKTVTVTDGDGDAVTGVVDFVRHGDTPQVNINGKSYNLSAVSQVHDQGNQATSSIGDYGAFAAGILGKTVTVQAIDSTGTTYIDKGQVSSLEIEKGDVRVIVNGYAYDVTDVVQVTETEKPVEKAEEPEEEYIPPVPAQTAQATQTVQETQSAQPAEVERTDDDDIGDIEDDPDIYQLVE
jgi:flagellar basal-body rod modification protein FlgD